jgi:hypothetical protein
MKRRLGAAVACLLAKRHREAVLGDLEEVGRPSGTPGHLGALIGIVVRFHAEPWRDDGARWGALVTVVLAGGLLRIVPAATWPDPGAVLALYDRTRPSEGSSAACERRTVATPAAPAARRAPSRCVERRGPYGPWRRGRPDHES